MCVLKMKYIFALSFLCLHTFKDVGCITCRSSDEKGGTHLTCENGCCGSPTNRTCCEAKGVNQNLKISGIIFGVVLLISVLILVAAVCERKYFRKRGRFGNPIRPHTYGVSPGKDVEPPKITLYHLPIHSSRR